MTMDSFTCICSKLIQRLLNIVGDAVNEEEDEDNRELATQRYSLNRSGSAHLGRVDPPAAMCTVPAMEDARLNLPRSTACRILGDLGCSLWVEAASLIRYELNRYVVVPE